MAETIYLASAEGNTGKSTVAVGLLEALARRAARVGVFRPVSRVRAGSGRDYVLDLLLDHATADLDPAACVGVTYEQIHHGPDDALEAIVERFRAVEAVCDAVLVVGSDYTDIGTPTELRTNARIAANLGATVLLTLGGRRSDGDGGRTADEVAQVAEIAFAEFRSEHASLLGVIVNRCDPFEAAAIPTAVAAVVPDVPVFTIPESPALVAPTLATVLDGTRGELVAGDRALLEREVATTVVAAMTLENLLPRLSDGALVVMPGDRTDVLLGVLLAHASHTFPALAGVLLTGDIPLTPHVARLIDGLGLQLPIARSPLGTFEAVGAVRGVRSRLAAESPQKYALAVELFAAAVDTDVLFDRLGMAQSGVVTPLMFEFGLLSRAREHRRHIVLPEGDDDRVLEAAGIALRRGIAELTILGSEVAVRSRAIGLGIDLGGAHVIDPTAEPLRSRFAEEYARQRAHKGVSAALARDIVTDVSYFGTLMEIGRAHV